MSKTAYNITLKGYIGGYYFNRTTVDCELAKNDGKQMTVLIDSLGGYHRYAHSRLHSLASRHTPLLRCRALPLEAAGERDLYIYNEYLFLGAEHYSFRQFTSHSVEPLVFIAGINNKT